MAKDFFMLWLIFFITFMGAYYFIMWGAAFAFWSVDPLYDMVDNNFLALRISAIAGFSLSALLTGLEKCK